MVSLSDLNRAAVDVPRSDTVAQGAAPVTEVQLDLLDAGPRVVRTVRALCVRLHFPRDRALQGAAAARARVVEVLQFVEDEDPLRAADAHVELAGDFELA